MTSHLRFWYLFSEGLDAEDDAFHVVGRDLLEQMQ